MNSKYIMLENKEGQNLWCSTGFNIETPALEFIVRSSTLPGSVERRDELRKVLRDAVVLIAEIPNRSLSIPFSIEYTMTEQCQMYKG